MFDEDYPGTLPFADLVDYSNLMELVPLTLLSSNSSRNVIDILTEAFIPDAAVQRLQYIQEIKHIFQYMLNPLHELIRFDQLDQIMFDDDAFTMTMKAALRQLCKQQALPESRCASGR